MIVALTSASLDITLGVTWWTLKQVFNGTIYLSTYLFSSSKNKKYNNNLIFGNDTNFIPYNYKIIELSITTNHTTINENNNNINDELLTNDNDLNFKELINIETTKTKDSYFCIPLKDIINRKDKLPLWIASFLNTYPLTNYSLVKLDSNNFEYKQISYPLYSSYSLVNHLNINNPSNNLIIYIKKSEIDSIIFILNNSINNK